MSTVNEYEFTIEGTRDPRDVAIVEQGLYKFNVVTSGIDDARFLAVFLRGRDGDVLGGLYGWTYWGGFEIKDFWLPENVRRKGFGSRLITLAEDEARSRGCSFSYLDTFSFQAPEFYKKLGYEVFGELGGFADGMRRYYLKKSL